MNVALSYVVAHWQKVAVAILLVVSGSLGYREGVRRGYHQGFSAGVASVPPCPKVESHAEVKEAKPPDAIAVCPKVRIRYVTLPPVPGAAGAGPTVIPEVSIDTGRLAAHGGTAEAGAAAEVTPPAPVRPPGGSGIAGGDDREWLLQGFLGGGGRGAEAGGAFSRKLGHAGLGLYMRSPLHDLKSASVGAVLSGEF